MSRFTFLMTLLVMSLPFGGIFAVETQLRVVATDDGLPNGSLTYTWTLKSSPTGVTPPQILATASAAIPTASSQNPRVVFNAAGSYTFQVSVSDGTLSTSGSVAQDVTITVLPQIPVITTSTLPAASVGVAYSQTLAATNSPLTWTLNSGALPAGLSLGATSGIISGTPTMATSTSTFTVTATNAGGVSVAKTLSLTVNQGVPVVVTTSLPGGTQNTPFRQTLQASPAATAWQLLSGALPAGLSLNGTSGEISGTPTASGTSNFSVTAPNSAGTSATAALSIVVVSQTNMRPTMSTIANQLIAKDTSTAVVTFNIWDNETPTANLTITAASSLTSLIPITGIALGGSGSNRTVRVTPAAGQSGRANVTLTVTDAGGLTGSTTFEMAVNAPPVIVSASATQTVLTLP
jgi:hypothetical protein